MSEPGCLCEANFRNDTANLVAIRAFVREKAAEAGFSEDELDGIELAVDEACANVMEHAYPPGMLDPGLHLSVLLQGGQFTVIIADRGETFDPSRITAPDMTAHLAEYRVGGLGIFLMRTLMDHVDYHIQPGIRNEVRMVKYLSSDRS